MKQQLALPDGLDLCSMAYAAQLAGCSLRTVVRAANAGRLTVVTPRLALRESKRVKRLLVTEQVREWATAYKLINRGERDG
jgi:hypothetical protein